jgi:WD40 repeat protein
MNARAILVTITGLLIAPNGAGRIVAQEPGVSAPAKPTEPKASPEATSRAVARLVEQLKRHAARPKPVPDPPDPNRFSIELMGVADGDMTLVAEEPALGLVRCGSPAWSHDGRRILFDATPEAQFRLSRLQSIDLGQDRGTVTDFGPGNCPTFSPADDRIAFLSNADGGQVGVWLMKADGSERRPLGDYGIPRWSPDGRQMMIIGFGNLRQVTLMDVNPDKSATLNLRDLRIHSVPSWAGEATIVAVIGANEGDRIALIDVKDPGEPRVKEVLWRRAQGPDVAPTYPIYSAPDRRCVFVGGQAEGMALYSVRLGDDKPAKPLSKHGNRRLIVNLAFSPDGRYVLFSDNGPR